MKESTLIEIVDKIKTLGEDEGVSVFTSNAIIHRGRYMWEVELNYKNYRLVERFDSGMFVAEDDVDSIAVILLRDLFNNYFNAKLLR